MRVLLSDSKRPDDRLRAPVPPAAAQRTFETWTAPAPKGDLAKRAFEPKWPDRLSPQILALDDAPRRGSVPVDWIR